VSSESASHGSTEQLIARLEQISRDHPQRVLRLRAMVAAAADPAQQETFELLVFRGFSSSTTHPTAFDPDQPVLPVGVGSVVAELLQGPLNPTAEQLVRGPLDPEAWLDPQMWH